MLAGLTVLLPQSALGKIFLSVSSSFLMLTLLLEPPDELLWQIFPWVESSTWPSMFEHRITDAQRILLSGSFLKLLLWLCTVLLQDAANFVTPCVLPSSFF